MIRSRRSFLSVLAAVGLVVGLGACSSTPGVAAEVGGTRITDAEVTATARDFQAISGQPVDRSQLVAALINGVYIDALGRENGIEVTDSQVADHLKGLEASKSVTALPTTPSAGLYDIVRSSLVQSKLQSLGMDDATYSKQAAKVIAQNPVTVNPRYGTYDPSTGMSAVLSGDVVDDATLSAAGSSQSGTGVTPQSGH